MKINLRQEIALWVLGLFLEWLLLPHFYPDDDVATMLARLTRNPVSLIFILLVPICLIVFSLRDRRKPGGVE